MGKAQNSTLDLLSCRIEDTSKGRHEKTLGHETTKLKRCGLQWKRGLRQNKRAHTLGSWWDHSGTKVRDEKMTQILRCSKWDNWRRSQSRLWNNNELRKEGKQEHYISYFQAYFSPQYVFAYKFIFLLPHLLIWIASLPVYFSLFLLLMASVSWLFYLTLLTSAVRRRQWHSTPVLLPGKSHGQRSLVGSSPWGC